MISDNSTLKSVRNAGSRVKMNSMLFVEIRLEYRDARDAIKPGGANVKSFRVLYQW